MGTGPPWLTGNANTEHSELATAQREQPNNPGSANKGSKTGSQRDHTPRQGLDIARPRPLILAFYTQPPARGHIGILSVACSTTAFALTRTFATS
jgi:hypothetical protein